MTPSPAGETTPPGNPFVLNGAFKNVTAGSSHSCGIRDDDAITCWGDSWAGETVAPNGAFRTVAIGDWQSCGIRVDDTITCWGSGDDVSLR